MKKYLLFIVEGKNDRTEIHAILRAACDEKFTNNYYDAYHVHNGDITTEKDTSEKTIIKKLNDIVIKWRNGGGHPYQKIATSDVEKIIHIVDTDGVFIPKSAIVQTDDAKVLYQDYSIHFYSREQIIGRNRKKAAVIQKLVETKQIDNIPYTIFFASCNMDHLLFNTRNPLNNDKGRNAMLFAMHCKDKQYLQSSIFSQGVCAAGSFVDSWEMIQTDYNSLARHTNLNLFLESLFQYDG